jgi:hypothetical protein
LGALSPELTQNSLRSTTMTVDDNDTQREEQASLFGIIRNEIRNALKSPFKSTKRKRSNVGDTDSDSNSDFDQPSVKRTQTQAEVRDLGITSSDSDASFDPEINLKQKSNVPLDSFAKIGIAVDVNHENSWQEGEIVRLELKEGSDEVFLYIIRIEKGELKGKEVSIEKKNKSRSLRHVDCIEKELLESGRPGEFELWKLLKSRITLNQRKAFVEWYSGENEKFSFDKFLKFQVPGGDNFLTMILCQNGNIDEKVVGTTVKELINTGSGKDILTTMMGLCGQMTSIELDKCSRNSKCEKIAPP